MEREQEKEKYCKTISKKPIDLIPKELKENFLYYEVSFSNSVTISNLLMINYYFKLNNETKKYLLKFRNDFCLKEFEDLTIYKNKEIKFYSCTHEGYNSIKIDYKNMIDEEISDFIDDENFKSNNIKIKETVKDLIEMPIGTKFTFKELGVSKRIMEKICNICDKLNLELVGKNTEELDMIKINCEEENEIPALFFTTNDIIEKKK